mgnify:CR=1 FL=1
MAGKMTVDAKKSLTQLINARKQKEQARPVEMSEEERIKHLKHWTTFYRRNLNIYVRDRLGIRLEPYQHLMLWLMSKSMVFVGICARGSAIRNLCNCNVLVVPTLPSSCCVEYDTARNGHLQ